MKSIRALIILFCITAIFPLILAAQEGTVLDKKIIVYGERKEPLKGAIISNTNENDILAVTDDSGEASFTVAEHSELIVRAPGYKNLRVVTSRDLNEVYLNTQKQEVQVAFREVDKKDLLGGVSYVDVESLLDKNYYTYSLDNMEALAPGYHGNLWGMNSYLLLVDGVPREAGNVMPTEIEQVSFLKGVSAVALYGSRAAKGVIYIKTKRGEVNKNRIDIRANAGVHVPKRYPLYLGSAEYMTLYNEARRNDGLTDLYSAETIYNHASGENSYRYPNVDYYSSDYLKDIYNRYDVTAEISGGNERARYYTNLGYNTSGSLLNFGEAIKNSNADRFNIRGNVDVNLTDYITTHVDATAIFYTGRGVNTNFWNAAATMRPHRFSPLIPIDMIEAEDSLSMVFVNNSSNIINGKYLLGGTQLDQANPIAAIYAGGYNRYISRQFQFNTGVGADLRNLLKGLEFNSSIAVDYATSYNLSYNNNYATYAPVWNTYSGSDLISSLTKYGEDARSGVQNVSNSWYRQTIAFWGGFKYNNTFETHHNVTGLLMANGFQQSESGIYHRTSNANLGLQLGYNFKRKYYFDFSGAVIHSAKLPEGNRQAFSPTVSLGWRISEESFMSNSSVVDDLKLTASAGIIYTDLDINDYYLYQGVYTSQGSWFGWKDGTGIQATESRRGDNRELAFPKRKEINFGFEGSFFKNLVTANASFFVNKITGNIIQASVLFPSYFTTGWPVSSFIPYINYNEDKRMGLDWGININTRSGEIDWKLGFVGTYYKTVADKRAEVYENDYQYRKGKPIDAIWGLESNGFFMDANDIANSPTQSFGQVKPGDIKYKDQNGDNVVDTRDEIYLGRGGWFGAPLTTGLNLTAKWKSFTFFALGLGRFGANGIKNSSYYWVDGEDKYSVIVRDRWTEATKNTAKYPRLTTFNSDNNFRTSDFWQYQADRFDLAKIQLSYDLSGLMGKRSFIKELGIYASGFNLLTFSPEREFMETNIGSAPQTRFYNIGVKTLF